MEHLDEDLTFPSGEMESLDFTTEEGGVSSSCLLHILPPDSAYSQGAGLDLHEYTATLSPSMSLAGLEETVLPTDHTVNESFETPESISINIPTSKVTQIDVGEQRNLLDVSFFSGVQNTEVNPGNTVEELQTATLDSQDSDDPSLTGEVLSNVSGTYLLAPQQPASVTVAKQPFSIVGSRSVSSKQTIANCITYKSSPTVTAPSVKLSSFQPLSGGLGDLNAVAPNVFLASANPKGNLQNYQSQHFLSKKATRVKGKKSVNRTTAAAATKGTDILTGDAASFPLPRTDIPTESREIRVELTQVSNDTTIVRLSFVHDDSNESDSTKHDLVLSPEVLSLLNEKGFQNINIESKEPAEVGALSSIEEAPAKQIGEINQEENTVNTVGVDETEGSSDDEEDNKPLLKVREEMAEQERSTSPNQSQTEVVGTAYNIISSASSETRIDLENDLVTDEQKTTPSGEQTVSCFLGTQEGSGQVNAKDTTQTSSVDWGALEDLSMENAEAEMASLLAESKLKMKTLARLDEIMIQITDRQCKVVNGRKRWCCEKCDKSYTTKNNLVVHTLGHNGIKPHVCMVCQRMFSQQSHLKTHILTHGNIRPHSCKVCHRTFTQLSHVKRHMSTHMDSSPYHCDICQRGFAYASELKAHTKKHTSAKDHECSQCKASFDHPRKLQFHMRTRHKNPDELTCKECGKQYSYPSQLRDHLIKHSGNRPFVCNDCGMSFMKEHHLKAHVFTHTGVKPWRCTICQRTFNQKANMMRHKLIHSVDKNFECEVCHKHFSQMQTLKAHMVVHSKKKPFQCKLCGKGFGRLHTLQGHMHIHEDTKPYVCFCGATFTLRGNLTRHQKVKHDITNPAHSTEEEAANILKAMSTKRAVGTPDTADDEPPPTDPPQDQPEAPQQTDNVSTDKVQVVENMERESWGVEDAVETAPLVANFHSYSAKSKP